MSAEIANLMVALDEIEDDINCREHDLSLDPDDSVAAADLDDLRCRRADAVYELKELGVDCD